MTVKLPFPLAFIRQFAGSLDADMVFHSFDELQSYLASGRKYEGQIATCTQRPGKIFVLCREDENWIWHEVSSDKHFLTNIDHAKEITITHNLNKKPSVTLIGEDNHQVAICDVTYIDQNTAKLSFSEYHTGKVLFN